MVASEILIVIILGLILGSFTTALVYRVPRDLAWSHGSDDAYRSACPQCKNRLGVLDLIPVFSWLMLKGRCRQCGTSIGLKYPLTEIGVVLACLAVYASFGFTFLGFVVLATVPFLMALLVIDLEHKILPNQLVAAVAVFGLIRIGIILWGGAHMSGVLFEYIGGAAFYAVIIWLMGFFMSMVMKKDTLGLGDVKFFFAAGLWLGLSNLALFCIIAGFFGIIFGVLWQAIKKERLFPFGPALIAALFGLVLVNGSLLL